MFRITIATLAFGFALLMQGCASAPEKPQAPARISQVEIADGIALNLTSPPTKQQGQGMQTLIKGRHGQSRYEMLMQIELNPNNIAINATTTSGVQLFEMLWFENAPHRLSRSPLAKDIEVQYLLADFQLAHWPKEQLLAALDSAKIKVTIEDKDRARTVYRNGEPVILIEYQTDFIAFEHLERRYRLTIKPLEKWQN